MKQWVKMLENEEIELVNETPKDCKDPFRDLYHLPHCEVVKEEPQMDELYLMVQQKMAMEYHLIVSC